MIEWKRARVEVLVGKHASETEEGKEKREELNSRVLDRSPTGSPRSTHPRSFHYLQLRLSELLREAAFPDWTVVECYEPMVLDLEFLR